MPVHTVALHTIRISAPVDQCQRFFTPAGEELWAEGWQPTYLHPANGRTEVGMVFTTGTGSAFTIWSLVDFDTTLHRARYVRVTPGSRSGFVEVRCRSVGAMATDVEVGYVLTALTPAGADELEAFQGPAFVDMIEAWREAIQARLPQLLTAAIR